MPSTETILVDLTALTSGHPFNGATFAFLALLLRLECRRCAGAATVPGPVTKLEPAR